VEGSLIFDEAFLNNPATKILDAAGCSLHSYKPISMRKFVGITTLIILVAAGLLFWWRFYFPFGEKGVKAGELNFVVYKGYVFKTWEGRLIQAGYKSQVPGSVQSNEFEFSVTNEAIAEKLRLSSGKLVELSYTEYLGAVPWRGNSKYIVDSIISIVDLTPATKSPY
jgi:hypothetical protein